MMCVLLLGLLTPNGLPLPLLRWPDEIVVSPMIATRRGRKEGRHAKLSVSKDIDEMEMMTCAENGIEGYDCRDVRGALPDTIPILTY